jgi:DNA-binding response OmpR family regulator
LKVDGRRHPGGTILVVEDTAVLRGLLVDYLEIRGYTVLAAEDATTAYELARRIPPDLVMTDANLPGEGSGASLAIRLRASAPDTSLVLMTGAADFLPVSEIDLFDCVLEKPFRLGTASAVIRCLLKGRGEEPAPPP